MTRPQPWWLYLVGIAFLLHILTRVLHTLMNLGTRKPEKPKEYKEYKENKEKQRT